MSTFLGELQLQQPRSTRTSSVAVIDDGDLVAGRYPILLSPAQGELRPSEIGVAMVASDPTILKSQALSGSRGEAFRPGLVLLAFGGGTSILLHFLVTGRLARISLAANQLAAGDLTVRSGVEGREEIALLGKSFESMVSDLEQHDTALVESEERHRSLFQHAVEGIVTMGEDRFIQSANPAAQSIRTLLTLV